MRYFLNNSNLECQKTIRELSDKVSGLEKQIRELNEKNIELERKNKLDEEKIRRLELFIKGKEKYIVVLIIN